MGTVRNVAAALAAAALLSVLGIGTASADDQGRCEKVAQITAKIADKKAKIAEQRARFEARQEDHPRAADWLRKHDARLDAAVARIEVKATKALHRCTT